MVIKAVIIRAKIHESLTEVRSTEDRSHTNLEKNIQRKTIQRGNKANHKRRRNRIKNESLGTRIVKIIIRTREKITINVLCYGRRTRAPAMDGLFLWFLYDFVLISYRR